MIVLDLFSGLEGFSQAFEDRGYKVITVDFLEKFKPTLCIDVMKLEPEALSKYGRFDIILASPPCNCFSTLTIRHYWKKVGAFFYPRDKKAEKAVSLIHKTLELIKTLAPRKWILENPRAMLRILPVMRNYERRTVTYCQYGEKYMKPTDLFGRFPRGFKARACQNNMKCHIKTERSSRNWSTGGIKDYATPELRARIPYALSLAICNAMELELGIISEIPRKNEATLFNYLP